MHAKRALAVAAGRRVAVLPDWLRVRRRFGAGDRLNIAVRLDGAIKSIWGRAWVGSMVAEVSLSIASSSDRAEITKEDRERRQTWIDVRVAKLVREGIEEKKAKRRAADQFKKENPWYREGSSRGKV